MKNEKTIYWVSTILLSLLTLMGVFNYFFNYEMVTEAFAALGYPAYLVYPLGVAKLLAIIAILTRKSQLLTAMAYAGLFYTFLLGGISHIIAKEGSAVGAFIALILLVASYHYEKKYSQRNK